MEISGGNAIYLFSLRDAIIPSLAEIKPGDLRVLPDNPIFTFFAAAFDEVLDMVILCTLFG